QIIDAHDVRWIYAGEDLVLLYEAVEEPFPAVIRNVANHFTCEQVPVRLGAREINGGELARLQRLDELVVVRGTASDSADQRLRIGKIAAAAELAAYRLDEALMRDAGFRKEGAGPGFGGIAGGKA